MFGPRSELKALVMFILVPGTATVQWKLLHVAAYFGHEQAVEAGS